MDLNSYTFVKFTNGETATIKEFFTKDEIDGKDEIEVTLVALLIPPGNQSNIHDVVILEDEKRLIKVKDLVKLQRIWIKK